MTARPISPTRVRAGRLVLVAGLTALSVAACGSTVPQQTTLGVGQGGGSADELGGAAGSGTGVGSSAGTTGAGLTGGTVTGGSSGSAGTSSGGATGGGSGGTGGTAGTTGRGGSGSTGTGVVGGAGGTGPGSTAAAAPTGPRVTTPVKIGFLNTKAGNLSSVGLTNGETLSPDKVFKILVNGINAQGGLAGRKVIPVIADTDTASNDWNTEYNAACERFTRDNQVAVVVGYSFVQLDSFENCLGKSKVPHLSGGYNVGDAKTLRDYPNLVAVSSPTLDVRGRLAFDGAVREGFVTKASKIGIIVDGCASGSRAIKDSVDPYVKAKGLNVVARTTINCPAGAGDAGPAVAQVTAAVLNFASKGVDRVYVEDIPLVLFSATAESQGYRPGYLVTSASNGNALEPNMSKAQQANVHGYGWMPMMDVTRGNQAPATPQQSRCLALLKSGGFTPTQFNDFLGAYTSCDGLFLYEAALKRTNGQSGADVVIPAITSLGTGYRGVGLYEGRTDYSGRQAPAAYRPWRFFAECSCFRYSGPVQAISR